jgi:hypothetical protein
MADKKWIERMAELEDGCETDVAGKANRTSDEIAALKAENLRLFELNGTYLEALRRAEAAVKKYEGCLTKPYADELGRQNDLLEEENAKLREELASNKRAERLLAAFTEVYNYYRRNMGRGRGQQVTEDDMVWNMLQRLNSAMREE